MKRSWLILVPVMLLALMVHGNSQAWWSSSNNAAVAQTGTPTATPTNSPTPTQTPTPTATATFFTILGAGVLPNGTVSNPVNQAPLSIANGGTGTTVAANQFLFPNFACSVTGSISATANTLTVASLYLDHAVTLSHVAFYISPGDATTSDLYGWGLYNSAGALVLHTAPTPYATTTYYLKSPVESVPVTLNPGEYYEGWTGTAATAKLTGCNSSTWPIIVAFVASNGTTASGNMPTQIATPAISPAPAAQTLGAFTLY